MSKVTINSSKVNVAPEAILSFLGGSIATLVVTADTYTVNLSGIGSNDPDGSIATYIWERSFNGGAYVSIGSTSSPSKQHIINQTGTYLYRLNVVDNQGLTDYSNILTVTFTKETTIVCDAKINGFNFQTWQLQPLFTVFVLDGRQSSAGNASAVILSYAWSVTSKPAGSNPVIANTSASKTSVSGLTVVGSYFIRLGITSSNGTTDSVLFEIRVQDTDENGNYL